jgi:hypothetical protein
MENLIQKLRIDAETSVARPALAPVIPPPPPWPSSPIGHGGGCLVTWRGNANSSSLSALGVATDSGDLKVRGSKNVILMAEDESLSETSPVAPTMTPFGASIVIAWIGTDAGRSLNVARIGWRQGSIDSEGRDVPGRWVVYSKVVLPHSSLTSPALTASAQAVYLAWVGRDAEHRMNLMRSNDGGSHWYAGSGPENRPSRLRRVSTQNSPALEFAEDTLYLVWSNSEGTVSATTLDPEELVSYRQFMSLSNETSHHAPAAAAWRGQCLIGWTGTDGGNVGHLNTMQYRDGRFFGQRLFVETSFTGPALTVVPQQPREPARLCVGWTGIDGAGTLNVGVVDEFAAP